ncbi:MAG: ribose-5-phosphate isomerase RpiA [Candidatus Promineifilaceae bacterium]|nr:ribose-5-phosphate isomerase RpiA [Candidatus Promineifilaceae bacterium]
MNTRIDNLKRLAANTAVDQIQSGMVIGLGSGSTATFMIQELGQRVRDGRLKNIIGLPTSEVTAQLALSLDIPLATLEEQPAIDLTIDGADEIDPSLDLIKGLGGHLLREKIIASVSRRMIVISDIRKLVDRLGTRAPLPVEVIPFARQPVKEFLKSLNSRPEIRQHGGQDYITDEGNIIYDCWFDEIDDPHQLGQKIIAQPGVVEHGFFLNMASEAVVAGENGIQILKR